MKVKVGNKIYNGNDVPVMVILTDKDKENIKNMAPNCTKYCAYPITAKSLEHDRYEIKRWMDED